MDAVRKTGLADEIIVEEYEGQKIDDIQRYGIDIFTVGSDWRGKFDYLSRYCKVVYLERTLGVSSTELRSEGTLRLGLAGDVSFMPKYLAEASYVNGLVVTGACVGDIDACAPELTGLPDLTTDYESLLSVVDAVYIATDSRTRSENVEKALSAGVHVLCESPVSLDVGTRDSLFLLAREKGIVLMEAIRPASCTAFKRLCRIVEGGAIGDVLAIDSTCTSTHDFSQGLSPSATWGSIYEWAPTALLPALSLFGANSFEARFVSRLDSNKHIDLFSRIYLTFDKFVATCTLARGAKSEGSLVITGTKGCAYVPAPWWKTDYFELRFEDASENRRFFWQLDGQGIRGQLVTFTRLIAGIADVPPVSEEVSRAITKVLELYYHDEGVTHLGG